MRYKFRMPAYSLLGILFSHSINLFLLASLSHYFLVINSAWIKYQKLTDYQQALLNLNHYLGADIRNSGFSGCQSRIKPQIISSRINPNFELIGLEAPSISTCKANGIDCIGEITSSILNRINTGDIKTDSDILILNKVPDFISYLKYDMTSSSDYIMLYNTAKVHNGDILHITDCYTTDRFCVSGQTDNILSHLIPENLTVNLSKAYIANSIVYRPANIIYYLRKSIIDDINHMHEYTLYRDDQQRMAQALIEGINAWEIKLDASSTIRTKLTITLQFKNTERLELIFVPRNTNRQ